MVTTILMIATGLVILTAMFYNSWLYFQKRSTAKKNVGYAINALGIVLAVVATVLGVLYPSTPRIEIFSFLLIAFFAYEIVSIRRMGKTMKDDPTSSSGE